VKYKVLKDGKEVQPGDKLVTVLRKEEWYFVSCIHPRKIHVVDNYEKRNEFWPDVQSMEYYPNVFGVEIVEEG
jgi:hypothetical protein